MCGTIVDRHGSFGKAVLFFEGSIHEEDRFARFRRTFVESLLKQVACTFELGSTLSEKVSGHGCLEGGVEKESTYVSIDELCQINVPDLKRHRECEQLYATLIHLPHKTVSAPATRLKIRDGAHFEALLEIFVLLQECSIVDDHLGIRDAKFENLVIDGFSCLYSTQRLFQVNVE